MSRKALVAMAIALSCAVGAAPATAKKPVRPPEPAPAPAPLPAPIGTLLLADQFTGLDGLISNSYAYWNGWDTAALTDPTWAVEGGSMFRLGSTAWTGVPDNHYATARDSSTGTGSQVFRAWTKRKDFASARIDFDLKNNGYTAGSADTPAVSWDGVKVWLHHTYDLYGYALEVNRRQGNVIIQKKVAAATSAGYAYHILCNTPWDTNPNPAQIGSWERVGAVARNNADGSVTLQVLRNGAVALQCVDNGSVGGAPLRSGDIGIRGDNTNFQFDNVSVTAAG